MSVRSTLAVLAAVGCLLTPSARAGHKLEVEPNHTSIGFSIPIAGGLTRVTGKFTEFEIFWTYEGAEPLGAISESTLEVKIVTASIDTGIEARDRHLRQADFFDAETYPEITFESERIESSQDGYVAIGRLSMHGITKTLELPFEITGKIRDQVKQTDVIGAVARTTLLRSDFNIAKDFRHTHMENFLGDEVQIEIFCWLRPAPEETERSDQTD